MVARLVNFENDDFLQGASVVSNCTLYSQERSDLVPLCCVDITMDMLP